jgi:hypothetical protein
MVGDCSKDRPIEQVKGEFRLSRVLNVLFFLCLLGTPVEAGEVDVIDVKVTKQGSGSYRFDVTLRHADTGWKHYADGWQVLGPNGKSLGKRTLYHPHVNEQPFTRSLSGVKIPPEIKLVTIRAHDSVHETGGHEMHVRLPH